MKNLSKTYSDSIELYSIIKFSVRGNELVNASCISDFIVTHKSFFLPAAR